MPTSMCSAAALEPADVVGRDPAQFGDLLASQTAGPAVRPAPQPDVLRAERFAPGPEERAEFVLRADRAQGRFLSGVVADRKPTLSIIDDRRGDIHGPFVRGSTVPSSPGRLPPF
jgi:hypothetical protein